MASNRTTGKKPLADRAGKGQRLHAGTSGDFWRALSLEELAAAQGVSPVPDVSSLYGAWPGEMTDGFEAAISELRTPGLPA
jgi:hypothetical protein